MFDTKAPFKTFKNPHRVSVAQHMKNEGLETEEAQDAYLEHLACDSVCPAMCDEGCEVEPDGRCEHNCPSIMLAMGVI